MKAVRIHTFGGLDVLKYEDAPKPEAGPGEVLVRVYAAGVNPVDWKIRDGLFHGREFSFPLILGWDVSGVVEATGPGVTEWKKGDAVYGLADIGRNGAYAEYIVMRAASLAYKPKSLDHLAAAAIPLAGLTAWQALFDHADLRSGQRVLIQAAAGGVGTFAVQLARWKGAEIAGTASLRNREFLHELGAGRVIDYQRTQFEDEIADVDLVIESLGGEVRTRSWKVLKRGGLLVSLLGPASAEQAAAYGVRTAAFLVQPNAAQLTQIAALVDAGRVRPIVEAVVPLAEAARAHEMNQTLHTRGKIVLQTI